MAERPLTDRETLPYLVVYCALYSAVSNIPNEGGNGWDIAGAVWSVLVVILGTIHIFRQNGGNEGRDFLQRYFAIGWVVSLRWVVILVLCFAACYIPLALLEQVLEDTQWYDFLIAAVLEAGVYWRIGHHVRDLALRTKAIPPVLK